MNTSRLTSTAALICRPSGISVNYVYDRIHAAFEWHFKVGPRVVKTIITPRYVVPAAEKLTRERDKC